MEPDGKTRLYYYHVNPVRVVEAAPNNEKWLDNQWTTGGEALEIYQRADFMCTSVLYNDGRKNNHIWSVHVPGQGSDKRFKVMINHVFSEQDFLDLIRKLERRAHKKGFTVLIS
jgi:hypothetical protein